MKPDIYLGENPYYFKYSSVRYTSSEKCANLGDCWEVYSPSKKDFELMKEGILRIEECQKIHEVNMTLLYGILKSLKDDNCFNPCLEIPCGEHCEHCRCLNCCVCDIRDYWEDKC